MLVVHKLKVMELHLIFKSVVCLVLAASVHAQRTIVVSNACPYTVWPGLYTTVGTPPNYTTGWEAAPGSNVTFQVPNNWTAGRIWGRRDCDFSANAGADACLDGGCNGGLICDPSNGTFVGPATLAEFTLDADGVDYYDVSVIDGFNLPMSITPGYGGCPISDCPIDLNPTCPTPLQGPFNATGDAVGCKSSCEADLDGDPSNSPNCCTGSFDTAATCPSSGVAYYDYFKSYCPNALCYVYDTSISPVICVSSLNTEFTITFCP